MKYIILTLIALCLILLLGFTNDLAKEMTQLRARDTILLAKIEASERQIDLNTLKMEKMVYGVREILKPYTKLIPIDGGYLAVREE